MRASDSHHDETLDDAVIHDVLRNERRRLVLERLRDSDDDQAVGDLAEHIAEVESGESPAPRNVRQSVYISLHQTHLPKLDTLHIVAYDSTAKMVSLGSNAVELEPYLVDAPTRRPFAMLTFTTCLAGLSLVLAGWMGIPILARVDPRLVAIVTLLAVALVSGLELGLLTRNRI
ncbi:MULTISPECIES: hypothetical protein [Haloferax]|uniref:DUF7344 domain-containing protein n=1 Tax=Haloferax marinum TaxID=2666143 RepID=A0A6A8G9V2_9EURY|nr:MULTISPECIES: hypothetical protein [Haloferax]KAB1198858.1 hypothetical protein Hfx1150_15545 [Haloferax sp. CBA1150]MRW97979.1 hypothetical protein [Haloferax marinum]